MKALSGSLALALCAALFAAEAAAQLQGIESGPVSTAEEQKLVDAALARGRLIYQLDQAAWHSTDRMLKALPQPRLAEVRGWVVEPKDGTHLVTYYGLTGETPYAVYTAEMNGAQAVNARVVAADEPRDLTPAQVRMVRARSVAAAAPGLGSCTGGRPNAVVIPPASDSGPVEVYILSPQVQVGQFPFGGHYRLLIDENGQIAARRAFTNGCVNMAAPSVAAALMVTHLLDRTPTEIHVFMANWTGKTLLIAMAGETRDVWEVTPTAMRKVVLPQSMQPKR